MRIERAVGTALGTDGHGDRSFDCLHDVGERYLFRGPRQGESAGRAAGARQKALGGQAAHQLLGGRQRNSGLLRQLARAEARAGFPAGGGGHDHDRIIGEMGQAHI